MIIPSKEQFLIKTDGDSFWYSYVLRSEHSKNGVGKSFKNI